MEHLKKSIIVSFGVCFIALAFSSCGDSPMAGKPNVIAMVNKEPILASELEHDIAIRTRQDPFFKVTPETKLEQLDIIIDKKLIIQEAVHRGLARDEKFVNTIRNFWEQTLVREFIDYKKKEFANRLSVTEEEIRNYYARLGRRVTFMVLKSADKSYVEQVYAQWRQEGKMNPVGWEIVGPVTYTEINSDILRQSFDAAINEVRFVEVPPHYYLVMVQERQEIPLQPMEALRPAIERDILALKEQQLLDEWLKTQRERAGVSILKPER
jgi:hypothetical protein